VLVLIGVLLVVAGFALRLNPLVVVTVAGIVTGLDSASGNRLRIRTWAGPT
jgi:uncharacterized membrane protein